MALQKAQHLRAGGRYAHKVVGWLEVEVLEHAFEVVDRIVVAELRSHLLGQPSATLIVAQHTELRGKPRRHAVPAVKRTAHLVQQHDCGAVVAGKLIMKAHSVGGCPRQGSLLPMCCSIRAWGRKGKGVFGEKSLLR